MRALTLSLLLVLLSTFAFANPSLPEDIYISFDSSGARVYEITPPAYSTVSAYVVVDMSWTGMNGLTTVSFKLSDPREDFPGSFMTAQFINLLPGGLAIGAWNEGITCASTECMSWPVVIGRLDCFYLGGPASICIEPHPDYPYWVVDCNEPGLVQYYVDPVSGRISGGDGDCHHGAPVRDVTWGAIKAQYE
jgi:hypothetical protein